MSEVILLTDSLLWQNIGGGRYVAAYALAENLRQNSISTVVIDYFTHHPDLLKYIESFITENTKIIGISSTFLSPKKNSEKLYINRDENIADFYKGELWLDTADELSRWLADLRAIIKKKNSSALIGLGGAKAQNAIFRPHVYSEFDFVVLGGADQCLVDLALTLKKNNSYEFKVHNGIKYLNNTYDLNHKICPTHDWTLNAVQAKESLPLEIARGCIFNCKFCHYQKKESIRKTSSDIKTELTRNFESFGTTTYTICDDCFNDHPNKVFDICNAFKSLNFKIEWISYARVDVAVKYPETLDAMMESGAKALFWGIETFNDKVSRQVGKGTPSHLVKELILKLNTKYYDTCLTQLSLITGLPGETAESLEATNKWFIENNKTDVLSVGSLIITPYISEFDKKIFDYAEYSRNPQKFGFTKVQFSPQYWEHETMNSAEANQWAHRISTDYRSAARHDPLPSVWMYPHFKTLGFDSTKAMSVFRTSNEKQIEHFEESQKQFQKFTTNYWNQLLESNC